jgi:hypothetical protein
MESVDETDHLLLPVPGSDWIVRDNGKAAALELVGFPCYRKILVGEK